MVYKLWVRTGWAPVGLPYNSATFPPAHALTVINEYLLPMCGGPADTQALPQE